MGAAVVLLYVCFCFMYLVIASRLLLFAALLFCAGEFIACSAFFVYLDEFAWTKFWRMDGRKNLAAATRFIVRNLSTS